MYTRGRRPGKDPLKVSQVLVLQGPPPKKNMQNKCKDISEKLTLPGALLNINMGPDTTLF